VVRINKFSDQVAAVYQDAVDNIRFSKLQQWQVTNYALLIYAAVYFLRDDAPLNTRCGKVALTAIVAITLILNLLVLWQLESSIANFRSRVGWVYQRCFTAGKRRDLVMDPKPFWYDPGIFVGLIAVSLVGAILIGVVVWFEVSPCRA